jgi:hypothetical protein
VPVDANYAPTAIQRRAEASRAATARGHGPGSIPTSVITRLSDGEVGATGIACRALESPNRKRPMARAALASSQQKESAMRLFQLAATLFAAVLLCAGCDVTVDQQTNVIVMDPATDEVRAVIVFEGIHARPDGIKEIRDFVEGGRQFCLGRCSWLSRIDLAPRLNKTEPGTGEGRILRAVHDLTRRHFVIRNRAFFLNPDGRLSGWQEITIRDWRQYVMALNDLISDVVALLSKGPKPSEMDDTTFELLKDAARLRHEWIQIEPGRVSVTIPGSPEFFAPQRARFLEGLLLARVQVITGYTFGSNGIEGVYEEQKRVQDLQATRKMIDRFLTLPWSVDQRHDRLTIALGYGGGLPLRLVDGEAGKELKETETKTIESVRYMTPAFLERTTRESIIAEFLKSGKAEPSAVGAQPK